MPTNIFKIFQLLRRVYGKLKYSYLLISLIVSILFGACTSLDDIYSRLDTLEDNVYALQTAMLSLQEAVDKNKSVVDVYAMSNNSGWVVTFSDGTSINIYNGEDGRDGKDGITPFLLIDQEGNWTISYDNGTVFTCLLDTLGNKISAIGIQGEKGDEGISVRVVVNSDGFYAIETYQASEPTVTLSETVTPYTSDDSWVVHSITQDDNTHRITLTLANGTSYTFNRLYVSPTGIVILSVNPVLNLGVCGSAEVEFRVNPSNAKFDYDVNSGTCEIALDYLGTATRSSYITPPSHYALSKVSQVYNSETGVLKEGQYKATVTDNGSGNAYTETAALVLSVKDGNGDDIQITSSVFKVQSDGAGSLATGLPIVYINTPNANEITSKTEWMEGAEIKILDYQNERYSLNYKGTQVSDLAFTQFPHRF
jgi:hypothetical protein